MRYVSIRTLSLIVAGVGVVLSAGCPGLIRRSAVNQIAEEIQPARASVIEKLESVGNPMGEGVIVFVRSDSSCEPQYSWVWLNELSQSYALDKNSQTLTPGLRVLSEASAGLLQRMGAKPETFGEAIRESLCRGDHKQGH
jgi:hypothetical protein